MRSKPNSFENVQMRMEHTVLNCHALFFMKIWKPPFVVTAYQSWIWDWWYDTDKMITMHSHNLHKSISDDTNFIFIIRSHSNSSCALWNDRCQYFLVYCMPCWLSYVQRPYRYRYCFFVVCPTVSYTEIDWQRSVLTWILSWWNDQDFAE